MDGDKAEREQQEIKFEEISSESNLLKEEIAELKM